MEDFETFEKVFDFFIHTAMDKKYVSTIDNQLGTDGTTTLTTSIQHFHRMRQNLCRKILEHVGFVEPLQTFTNAHKVIQYNKVPQNSECIFSKRKLQPEDGTLIIVDNQFSYTFDKRFKTIVFYFWYMVHLPDELIINAMKWMKSNKWWRTGQVTYEDAVTRLQHYNNKLFAKQAYVKLKSVCKYIQTDMAKIRINST